MIFKFDLLILQTVGEVKAHILSHLGLPEVYEGGRLRLEDDDIGVRPPREWIIIKFSFIET